jgi:23S rRNA pseudouridine1911/1915/1917 synthase
VPATVTTLDVQPNDAGQRLDAFIAGRGVLPRSQAEKLAKEGRIRVNGQPAKAGHRVQAGERVEVPAPAAVHPPHPLPPSSSLLPVLFQDDAIIVVNKPPGLAVHPGAGRPGGTLVDILLAQTPALRRSGGAPERPGIVHRLDRDTSGVMVVAKTAAAYHGLSRQVRARTLDRRYLALAWGRIGEDRLVIDVPIGRAAADPTRMVAAAAPGAARLPLAAETDIRVLQRTASMTVVEARLVTGRTHQIRVHLAHVGHPVVGDPLYGRRTARRGEAELDAETLALVKALPGQALHAQSLAFRHPITGQEVRFSAPPYPEMARLLVHLRASVV